MAIRRQSSSRDDAVNMGVQQQVLPPGMQDTNQADFSAQVFGVGRHLQQCLGAGFEQQIVEQALVVQRQHVEFVRHGEHDMEVVGRQQVTLPGSEPAIARLCLALRTVPIAARVVGDGRLVSATGTGIDMAAQRRCAASLDGPECLELLEIETLLVPVQEAVDR